MKRIPLFSTVMLLLAALLATGGCDNGNNDKGEKARQDSIRVADSLHRVDSLRNDSIMKNTPPPMDSTETGMDSSMNDNGSTGEVKTPKPDPVVSTGRLDKCYFKVSFISIGSGTDGKAIKKLIEEIAAFEKAENVTLTYEKKNWGREGEQDYCFSSLGMTDAQREKWAKKIRKAFQGNELVQIPD